MLAVPGVIEPSGPLALFAGSFLASTLLPGGSEAMLLYAVSVTPEKQNLYWLIATLGNSLGGMSSWLLGWWIARRFPERILKKPEQRRAVERIARRGSPILLLSWLPVIGDPLCLAAGWSGTGVIPSALFITIGKALRYALLLGVFHGMVN
ncbi:MAG: DedA family protein [Gammaproteobacteria bacterium]|nr:DedA family protein [Gammaproteobacteria bacterium]